MPTLVEPTLENLPSIEFPTNKKGKLKATPLKAHNPRKISIEDAKSESKKMIELEDEYEYDNLFD